MNTLQYLDAAKKALGIESDYALSKELGCRPSTISGYRQRGGQMDDEIAIKVARILSVHPGFVLLDMVQQRAKSAGEQSVWADVYKGFRKLLPHAKSEERRFAPRLQQ